MKQPVCTICNRIGHTQTFCFNKKNKAITKFGKEAKKDMESRNAWLQSIANKDGEWPCYLQISPLCPKILTIETITKEHIKPKGSHRELAHEISNFMPACIFCNGLKGSRSLERLAEDYPHLKSLLDTDHKSLVN
jgi:hypothetical protein